LARLAFGSPISFSAGIASPHAPAPTGTPVCLTEKPSDRKRAGRVDTRMIADDGVTGP
jgi:hypothetical protein